MGRPLSHTRGSDFGHFLEGPPFRHSFLKRQAFFLGSEGAGFAFPGSPTAPALVPSVNSRQANHLWFILDRRYQHVIACRTIGTRTWSAVPKLMRLRRAVPEIPAKISAPPGLPLNTNRSLPTRSESILPQPLIPLHFISFRYNVYKKPGEGTSRPSPKVLQLATTRLPVLRTHTNTRRPNPLYALIHNSLDARGVGGDAHSQWGGQILRHRAGFAR